DRAKGNQKYIQPKHTLGENPYRFNWQTPIHLSKHNQDILYLGGNKLHRSLNQGDDWETISGDLTTGGKKGNVAYGTLTSISESPFQFGLIYVGSDDGYINVTKNGGGSWKRISDNLPQDLWVSRVIASAHKKERVYATLNGYRFDDFTTYVYKSDNYGQTWENIGEAIPASPVNVIKEDPENENILYVGSDNGLYVSFDKGSSWSIFNKNLPNVAVHDLVVQPTAKHLIVATHGRSLYKADVSSIQKMTDAILAKQSYVFDVSDIRQNRNWGRSWSQWRDAYEPEITIPFYVNAEKKVDLEIYQGETLLNAITVNADKGYNEFNFDVSFSKKGLKNYEKANKDSKLKAAANDVYYLPKGKYVVKIGDAKSEFEIK
ncbi:MAG: glycosyl hydrolase, partial [Flavobacteriales bacterium]